MTREEIYQQESDILFESFLNRYYFDEFRGETESNNRMIELFIRGVCPSNCKYCYLIKHSEELYPYNVQKKETLLHNLDLFCKWYIKNKFKTNICFFTGEIVKNGLVFDIFDILYKYFSDELNPYRPKDIIYPENGDFIDSDELTEKMQSYIDKFKNVGITLALSLSIDGKYMDKNRDKEHSDEFYAKIGKFADKNFFGFHPMVSAYNVDKWIENYDWWVSDKNIPKPLGNYLMMLEVRDDNWTNEAIKNYLKFLDHVIEVEFNKCGQDKLRFGKRIFKNQNILNYYDNIAIGSIYPTEDSKDPQGMTCSVQKNLCIRLGDFAIVPCHRTSYDKFINGYLKVDENNENIVGYQGKNIELLTTILTWNRDTVPFCADCNIKYWCPGPCFGSSYEASSDLFKPCDSVCNLFKAKIMFLLMKYDEMGMFEIAKEILSPNQYSIYDKALCGLRKEIGNYEQLLRNAIDTASKNGESASGVRGGVKL